MKKYQKEIDFILNNNDQTFEVIEEMSLKNEEKKVKFNKKTLEEISNIDKVQNKLNIVADIFSDARKYIFIKDRKNENMTNFFLRVLLPVKKYKNLTEESKKEVYESFEKLFSQYKEECNIEKYYIYESIEKRFYAANIFLKKERLKKMFEDPILSGSHHYKNNFQIENEDFFEKSLSGILELLKLIVKKEIMYFEKEEEENLNLEILSSTYNLLLMNTEPYKDTEFESFFRNDFSLINEELLTEKGKKYLEKAFLEKQKKEGLIDFDYFFEKIEESYIGLTKRKISLKENGVIKAYNEYFEIGIGLCFLMKEKEKEQFINVCLKKEKDILENVNNVEKMKVTKKSEEEFFELASDCKERLKKLKKIID